MLPNEAETTATISKEHSEYLEAMSALLRVVVTMLSQDWTVPKRGLNEPAIHTVVALFIKAVKTFRSIQVLVERGLTHDANALLRVLLETITAIGFLLQKRTRLRVLIYHANSWFELVKMFEEWTRTPGLKRKITKAQLVAAREARDSLIKKLPPGIDYKRHWSGKGSLQAALQSMRGDVLYSTLYRASSSTSHGTDSLQHMSYGPGDAVQFEVSPSSANVPARAAVATELLWLTARRIDERFKLGFSDQLKPLRPRRPTARPTMQHP